MSKNWKMGMGHWALRGAMKRNCGSKEAVSEQCERLVRGKIQPLKG